MFEHFRVFETEFAGKKISFETGKMCCLATGAEGEDAPRWKGRRCLLLGGEAGWAFLCLAEPDSLGRIREVVITNDSRLDVEPG